MSSNPTGAAINPIADGVGVMGGIGFVARFLLGVDGDAASSFDAVTGSEAGFFRFFEILAIFGGVEDFTGSIFSFTSREAALSRAERLWDILAFLGKSGEQREANTGFHVETGRRCSLMAGKRIHVAVVIA